MGRKGIGVDCVHFIAGVYDDLAKAKERTILPLSPQDSGFHGQWQVAASKSLMALHARYPLRPVPVDSDGCVVVQPGDFLVALAGSGEACGASHVYLVGTKPAVWHSDMRMGVCRQAMPPAEKIMHVWRAKDRSVWRQ